MRQLKLAGGNAAARSHRLARLFASALGGLAAMVSRSWQPHHRGHLARLGEGEGDDDLPESEKIFFILASVALVCLAGLMSGLTLGLMSLDVVDLQVILRSGSERERGYARKIAPVVKHPHFLLVTLVLCNAFATETLPIFLDRLTTPLAAVALSMSVVLLFGEVIPQAVCSRYGLAVGAQAAWFVKVLMVVCWPVAAPLAAILDRTLGGGDHGSGGGGSALFRRAQLKALVDVHAEDEGLGGNLTVDEVAVIRGALDLSAKTATCCLTPIDRVFALPTDARLDGKTLRAIVASGHSRVPVHSPGDKEAIVGVILVKELLVVARDFDDDEEDEDEDEEKELGKAAGGAAAAAAAAAGGAAAAGNGVEGGAAVTEGEGDGGEDGHHPEVAAADFEAGFKRESLRRRRRSAPPLVADLKLRTLPHLRSDTKLYDMLRLFETGRCHMAVLVTPPKPLGAVSEGESSSTEGGGSEDDYDDDSEEEEAKRRRRQQRRQPTRDFSDDASDDFRGGAAGAASAAAAAAGSTAAPAAAAGPPSLGRPSLGRPSLGRPSLGRPSLGGGGVVGGVGGRPPSAAAMAVPSFPATQSRTALAEVLCARGSRLTPNSAFSSLQAAAPAAAAARAAHGGEVEPPAASAASAAAVAEIAAAIPEGVPPSSSPGAAPPSSSSSSSSVEDALGGRVLGIVTIEDVIEELIGHSILDETDRFEDRRGERRVNARALAASLPSHLRELLRDHSIRVGGGGVVDRGGAGMAQGYGIGPHHAQHLGRRGGGLSSGGGGGPGGGVGGGPGGAGIGGSRLLPPAARQAVIGNISGHVPPHGNTSQVGADSLPLGGGGGLAAGLAAARRHAAASSRAAAAAASAGGGPSSSLDGGSPPSLLRQPLLSTSRPASTAATASPPPHAPAGKRWT